MRPYFSVVISVFNKSNYISSTLQSVNNQTFKDFEIIIVNDGSKDNSLEIIKKFSYPNIIIIDQENKGAANARNTGIKRASGKYIALLDGDDLWDKNYLQEMAKAIKKYPIESVFSCAIAHKNRNKIFPARYNKNLNSIGPVDYFQGSSDHSILSSSSTVFAKSILTETGYFNEDIMSGQDTDLWIRFGIRNNIVFIKKVLVYYVQDENSLSNSSFDLKLKPKFNEYKNEEKLNKNLARFLNKNRFSLALMSKIHSDTKSFEFYNSEIDRKYLNNKEKVLLSVPLPILNLFLWVKKIQGKKLYYKPLN